jgi:voltage-gated potassium channel
VITITTCGYGDVVPATPPGRIVAMFTVIFGAFLISLVVVTVQNILNLD